MVKRRLSGIGGICTAGAALLLVSSAAATEIYRWVDADGTVHFGDRPPADHPIVKVDVLPPPAAGPAADDGESALEPPPSPRALIVPAGERLTD